MDLTKIENIEVDGIDYRDAPDFCDAFISYAEINGVELTDSEYNKVNEDSGFIHEQVYNQLY